MISAFSTMQQSDPYFSPEAPLIDPAQLPSWLVHEDEDVLVFNKPGWLVCHPSKNGPYSSLVGAVREWRTLDHVHLVSRLDRETSGVVILAKHRKAASRLQVAFAMRNTRKRYTALLQGRLQQAMTAESQLVKDPDSPVFVKQAIAFGSRGKSAVTVFEPLRFCGDFTLCSVTPITGRKHQIRAHAHWIGHPIAGDKLYGPDPLCYLSFIEHGWTPELAQRLHFIRQALHAEEIHIHGDDWHCTFTAPCPFDSEGFFALARSLSATPTDDA